MFRVVLSIATLVARVTGHESGLQRLSVAASGLVQNAPNNGGVVRKVARKSERVGTGTQRVPAFARRVARKSERAGTNTQRVSVFAGLLRKDHYSTFKGLECSSKHGGNEIDSDATRMTLQECQTSCAHDDDCTCINFKSSSGMCRKLRYCHTERCVPSSLLDTYVQRSSFNISRNTTNVFTLFERSGGRECTAAADSVAVVGGPIVTSISGCLHTCNSMSGCSCVRFARDVKECDLLSNCPLPTFCARSGRFDMYVAPDAVTTPSPTQQHQQQPAQQSPM